MLLMYFLIPGCDSIVLSPANDSAFHGTNTVITVSDMMNFLLVS